MTLILALANKVLTRASTMFPPRYRYTFLLSVNCLAFRRLFLEIFGRLLLRFREPFFYENFGLKKGDIFIDVGSHIGQYCLLAAKRVGPKGKVIAIEPHPANFTLLEKNMKANHIRNMLMLKIAISNEDGYVDFYVNPESTVGHSILSQESWSAIRVKSRKLDSLITELDLKRVNLVKIDVEGAEFEVLRGAEQTLKNLRPELLVEVHKHPGILKEIIEYLGNIGYVNFTRTQYDSVLLFSCSKSCLRLTKDQD